MIVGGYNRLVGLKNRYLNAFSQIDVQLKRRHDLIPNLVETAKGYLQHERQTLEAVIAARNAAVAAREQAAIQPGIAVTMQALTGAESNLISALGKFIGLAEAYPDLKANAAMARLMEELTSAENRVAFARQAYNDAVMFYNTARETFPSSLIASMFKFGAAEMFLIRDAGERHAPNVVFP